MIERGLDLKVIKTLEFSEFAAQTLIINKNYKDIVDPGAETIMVDIGQVSAVAMRVDYMVDIGKVPPVTAP